MPPQPAVLSLRSVAVIGAAIGAIAALAPTLVLANAERAERLTRMALELDASQARGASLYRSQCADCHGAKAHGDAQRSIPALAGQRRAYVIKQLVDFVERDRSATQMHAVISGEPLGEPQTWADIALYVNRLAPLTAAQTGDGRFLSLGEASYEQWCASCHEADGRGDDDGFVPSLRNQHYAYLLKEMRGLAAGHRFNVETELSRFLKSLESEEMMGLADHLSRMSGPLQARERLNVDGTVSD